MGNNYNGVVCVNVPGNGLAGLLTTVYARLSFPLFSLHPLPLIAYVGSVILSHVRVFLTTTGATPMEYKF